jgi:hypothetical protein
MYSKDCLPSVAAKAEVVSLSFFLLSGLTSQNNRPPPPPHPLPIETEVLVRNQIKAACHTCLPSSPPDVSVMSTCPSPPLGGSDFEDFQ